MQAPYLVNLEQLEMEHVGIKQLLRTKKVEILKLVNDNRIAYHIELELNDPGCKLSNLETYYLLNYVNSLT